MNNFNEIFPLVRMFSLVVMQRVVYPQNFPNQTCNYWLITPNQQTLCIETNVLLWVLAMVLYASLRIEGLTSKMVSLGLRHSKKITLPIWFMIVWPPLWLKNTESVFFSKYAK